MDSAAVPEQPKIYHIVHEDRLPSIIARNGLWCNAEVRERGLSGTNIGMSDIKRRRFNRCLQSHADLRVGDCVPFYFCPCSVMLYVIYRGNHKQLAYRDGQEPIIHLEADLYKTVQWAEAHSLRWAFTTSNAAASYCEDYSDLGQLGKIGWDAVKATQWSGPDIPAEVKERKQAEFLVERCFPWHLVERIGVRSPQYCEAVRKRLQEASHKPEVTVIQGWYY